MQGKNTVATRPKQRLLYLDMIRGVFLVFIILNHIPYSPKLTDLITGNSVLIVSAAEGFFLISGTMVGLLYTPRILTETKKVLKKIWSRSLLLYLISISTTLLFTIIAKLTIDVTQVKLYAGNIPSIDFIQHLLSLNYTYGWADFLSLYAVFMLLAPITLFLIAYKKTWIALLISLLIWFVHPVFGGMGNFAAWQILFTIGIIMGANFHTIVSVFDTKKGIMWIRSIFCIVVILIAWSWYVDLVYPHFIAPHVALPNILAAINDSIGIPHSLYVTLFDRDVMGIGRIALATLGFLWLLYFFRRYEPTIKRLVGSPLMYLGKNSLLVYVIHSFVIFTVFIVFLTSTQKFGIIDRTILGILIVACVYWFTHIYRSIEHLVRHEYRRHEESLSANSHRSSE